MKTFIIRGALAVALLSGCGGDVEPSLEGDAMSSESASLELPACEAMDGQTCRVRIAECTWQSNGALGVCLCKNTSAGLRWGCQEY
ncbi:hypothetical protein [Myxococcus sp. AS-1-15]|jgi:hypothetical protein|uniref:hypothetical protein n=1 Tax=Myxococcus sp. AS-1-15 TaxID=2874600 RepID=UPI001CBD3C27|nr:hypothetical protein [Myxococcus sp. AS-1-15]MBZ4401928.1 hypothetical protein [Myxococcus sp. AS-1-15]